MKRIGWIGCALTALLLSCGENKKEFVVEGTINNLGGYALYAVYEPNNKLVVDTLRPKNGHISLRNVSEELIPIQFYYADKTPFTKLYVKNGDRIELSGDGEEPFGLTVKGSAINKQLFEFNQTHKALLQNWLDERNKAQSGLKGAKYETAYQELQNAIVDYVSQKPNHPVSAILIGEYLLGEANKTLCDSLIGLLDEKLLTTPPAASIQLYRQFQESLATDSILPSLHWITPADTTDLLDCQKAMVTLLYFQSSDHFATLRHYRQFMEHWSKTYSPDTLQLIEISLDRDSAVWLEKIKSDTVKWERRWLQENYLTPGMKQLNIHNLPYLIVADSTGQIITRGLPPDSIEGYFEQIIYPDSIHSSNRE